jgi:hypothetical protein
MIRRFDAIGYKEMAMSERCLSVKRDVERGFLPFITETLAQVDKLTTSRQQQLSLCELGIGGGGAHELMFQFSEDTHILGVDLFHKDHLEHYKTVPNRGHFLKNHERLSKDQDLSLLCCGERQRRSDQRPNRKESLFHGMNAYKQSTAEHLVSVNGAKLDYVNDDAAPNLGALNGLMDAYKDSISDVGILISTGPFGNGTPEAYARWETGQYLKDCEVLAEQGFVIFDMTEYRHHRQFDPYPTGYILSILAAWAPDFNNYKDLFVKYEHNIINGKENLKND